MTFFVFKYYIDFYFIYLQETERCYEETIS